MSPKQCEYSPVMKPIKFLSKKNAITFHYKRDLLCVRDIGVFGKQFLHCFFFFSILFRFGFLSIIETVYKAERSEYIAKVVGSLM